MKVKARGLARITAIIEELPNLENRVELASEKDEFGMPLARIVHNYDDDATACGTPLSRKAQRSPRPPAPRKSGPAAASARQHLLGGTIMGTAPETPSSTASARPTRCRTSTSPAAASSRPTSAANPTFTLYALSLRGAEQLAANWSSIAG